MALPCLIPSPTGCHLIAPYLIPPYLIYLPASQVEIGCRKGEVLSREEFGARREAAEQARKAKLQNAPKVLASAQKDLTSFPFLRHLAAREELVRHGKLSVIIFIRDTNSKGQEISGYIDYGHRLKMENFEPYFERTNIVFLRAHGQEWPREVGSRFCFLRGNRPRRRRSAGRQKFSISRRWP